MTDPHDSHPTCNFISNDNQASDTGLSSVARIIYAINRQFYSHFILVFGPINILANMASMFILTRKELRGAYSYLFFAMILDQTVVVLFLIASQLRSNHMPKCDLDSNTLAIAVFTIVSRNATDIFRAHASWLAVMIASLRFVAIRHRGFLVPSFRKILVLCSVSFLTLLGASTPVFLSTSIEWEPYKSVCRRRNSTTAPDILVAAVRESEWVYHNDCMLLRITYFIAGTVYSGIPCILLFALSVLLLRHLRLIRKEFVVGTKTGNDRSNADNRVTKMMTAILISTITSEAPQSVLNILIALLPSGFKSNVVDKLGNILMTIMIITSACNLFIYLSMSKNFKEIAKGYFRRVLPCKTHQILSKIPFSRSSARS